MRDWTTLEVRRHTSRPSAGRSIITPVGWDCNARFRQKFRKHPQLAFPQFWYPTFQEPTYQELENRFVMVANTCARVCEFCDGHNQSCLGLELRSARLLWAIFVLGQTHKSSGQFGCLDSSWTRMNIE